MAKRFMTSNRPSDLLSDRLPDLLVDSLGLALMMGCIYGGLLVGWAAGLG